MKRRIFLAHTLGLAASALGFTLAGMAGRSFAASVQSHRVLDLELIDADRQRPVPIRLYLPEQANPAQPVPLVVFSHGLAARAWDIATWRAIGPTRVLPACTRNMSAATIACGGATLLKWCNACSRLRESLKHWRGCSTCASLWIKF